MTRPAGSFLYFAASVAFWAFFAGFLSRPAAAEESFTQQWRVGGGDEENRPASLRAIAVSPDGRLVALAGEPEATTESHVVQLREAATGKLVRTLAGHESTAHSLAFSRKGDRLATITRSADDTGFVRVFDVETGTRIHAIACGGTLIRFLPDDRLLAAGFSRLYLFDAERGDEVGRFPVTPIVKDVSRDGRRVVGVSHHGSNRLEVRDPASETPLAELDGCLAEPLAALFSPDARTVAASDPRSRGIHVWEVLTGQRVHTFETGTTATALSFSEDGRVLIAGGVDGSLRAWDVATGSELVHRTAHDGAIMALSDGPKDMLLSGSTDRTVIRWSIASLHAWTLPTTPPTTEELDAAWDALAGHDAKNAYRSLGLIARQGDPVLESVLARVERQLRPVPNEDLTRLLAELNAADYRIRERALSALSKVADSRRTELDQTLAATPSPEVRARLRVILQRTGRTPRFNADDALRLRRLMGAADSLPAEKAEYLLRLIGDEFPDAAVAGEARDALRRIEDQAARAIAP